MTAPHRRGACPGLSAPMATGDGLLVRLLPVERIALDAFVAICRAAQQHGNGTIEVTARGSLQLRGLTPRSAPLLAADIAALEITAADGVPVIANPLPDDPEALIDASRLAATLRGAIADAGLALAPKVSVVVDGGGQLHLDALNADLRLRAYGSVSAPRLQVALGGDGASATSLGSIEPDAAVNVAVHLLGIIAARGPDVRAVDILRTDGIDAFGSIVDGATATSTRPPAEPIGQHPLRDGTIALGLALAFGHAHARALEVLAHIAGTLGVASMRPAPGRVLLLIGVAEEKAAALAHAAEQLGFIVRADDPRRRIAACPGLPACASGLIAARALAVEIARQLPAGSPNDVIHVSGCAKGCAHPAPATLTVVGTERGCGIVRDGAARASPRYHVGAADVVAEVVRIAAEPAEAVHG